MQTTPIYSVTSYEVAENDLGYTVANTLDGTRETFDDLRDALEYADNGELSPDAVRCLMNYYRECMEEALGHVAERLREIEYLGESVAEGYEEARRFRRLFESVGGEIDHG